MEIAVASVEDIADLEPIVLTNLAHTPEHIREFCSGHDAILNIELRADPSDRAKGIFASGPEQLALGLGCRDTHYTGVVFIANTDNLLNLFRYGLAHSLSLH